MRTTLPDVSQVLVNDLNRRGYGVRIVSYPATLTGSRCVRACLLRHGDPTEIQATAETVKSALAWLIHYLEEDR